MISHLRKIQSTVLSRYSGFLLNSNIYPGTYQAMGRFSKYQTDDIFLIFLKKKNRTWHFMQNCLIKKQFARSLKSYFLGKWEKKKYIKMSSAEIFTQHAVFIQLSHHIWTKLLLKMTKQISISQEFRNQPPSVRMSCVANLPLLTYCSLLIRTINNNHHLNSVFIVLNLPKDKEGYYI